MKSLSEYLLESKKQYIYRVKVAGELEENELRKFKESLSKFDMVSCSEPKKTPITKNPLGFPDLKNAELHIFDITLNYPANPEQIVEMGRLCGINPAMMVVVDKAWDESMQAETDKIEEGPLLDNQDYPNPTEEQKQVSKDYSESFKDIVKNSADIAFDIAGGTTPKARFNTDEDDKSKSPMTNIHRETPKEMTK